MSSKSKIEKWIIADWSSNRSPEVAKTTETSVKSEQIAEDKPADKSHSQRRSKANESAGSGTNAPPEDKDYSPSASSWEPTDDSSSSEDSDNEVTNCKSKTIKMEQYIRQYVKKRNSKKVLTPVHRPNAVVNVLQERQINGNNRSLNDARKRKYYWEIPIVNKSLPDSTQKKVSLSKEATENIIVRRQAILEMKQTFEELFKIINEIRPVSETQVSVRNGNMKMKYLDLNTVDPSISKFIVHDSTSDSDCSERSQSEESNRSNDNVLITNKYHKIQPEKVQNDTKNEIEEWIPIGSGKTLIHKDKYRKVNWKSYTIATRTLLLATFPRRILATHSLTGKRSPAFQDKPAKMCLDPKIVSDIIIEITSKFKVKENLRYNNNEMRR
ncbi:unnamed protein product, partial [Brenthis ino]